LIVSLWCGRPDTAVRDSRSPAQDLPAARAGGRGPGLAKHRTVRRFVAALFLVTVLAGAAQAQPTRPVPQQPRPTLVVRLLRQVIGPVLVA
jgi:hypothetical protein